MPASVYILYNVGIQQSIFLRVIITAEIATCDFVLCHVCLTYVTDIFVCIAVHFLHCSVITFITC